MPRYLAARVVSRLAHRRRLGFPEWRLLILAARWSYCLRHADARLAPDMIGRACRPHGTRRSASRRRRRHHSCAGMQMLAALMRSGKRRAGLRLLNDFGFASTLSASEERISATTRFSRRVITTAYAVGQYRVDRSGGSGHRRLPSQRPLSLIRESLSDSNRQV